MPLLCQSQKQRIWEDAGETSHKSVAGGSHPVCWAQRPAFCFPSRRVLAAHLFAGLQPGCNRTTGGAITDLAGPPRTSSIANPGHGIWAEAFFLSTPRVVLSCSRVENS